MGHVVRERPKVGRRAVELCTYLRIENSREVTRKSREGCPYIGMPYGIENRAWHFNDYPNREREMKMTATQKRKDDDKESK